MITAGDMVGAWQAYVEGSRTGKNVFTAIWKKFIWTEEAKELRSSSTDGMHGPLTSSRIWETYATTQHINLGTGSFISIPKPPTNGQTAENKSMPLDPEC